MRQTRNHKWRWSLALLVIVWPAFVLAQPVPPGEDPLPPAAEVKPPVLMAAPPASSVPPNPPAPEETSGEPLAFVGHSLFFSADEIADIRKARAGYVKRITGQAADENDEDFLKKLSDLKDTKGQSRFFTYPQFYLASLVYHHRGDWIVWVNHQKFTADTPKDKAELQVVKIDENQATLLWKPQDMSKVTAVWDILSKDSHGVDVDTAAGTVTFTLKTNQTFSSYVMRPLEGKVLPVTVDAGAGDAALSNLRKAAGGKQGPEAAPPQAEPPKEEGVKEGLLGLIGAYRKTGEQEHTP